MVKALREAKVNSNWDDPDMEYEQACKQFIHNLFQPRHAFLASFKHFVEKISTYAGIYSLAQVLIKFTAPGIPDIYQGCELWDFSYVDPDNRRPVNFARRKKMLKALQEKSKKALIPRLPLPKRTGVKDMKNCSPRGKSSSSDGSTMNFLPKENTCRWR